ncbi:hypothetical protein BC826DRAFT_489081 [Russula brevipes]|nr:hypothetical protein BC826DRAFT_489081 [Russula brevipes]
MCRSEVYRFVLSLISLRPVMELLLSVPNVRSSSGLDAQAPHSPIIVRTTLVAVVAGTILGTLTALQLFTKVVHLRALHQFLANDTLTAILVYAGVASMCYVEFYSDMHVLWAQDIHPAIKGLVGDVMPVILVSLYLLLSTSGESPTDSLAPQPAKGWLVMCLLIAWAIFEIIRYPHWVLLMYGTVTLVLDRFLSTLPISWHFSIASVRKAPRAVYIAIWRAGRKAWGYFVRVVHRG